MGLGAGLFAEAAEVYYYRDKLSTKRLGGIKGRRFQLPPFKGFTMPIRRAQRSSAGHIREVVPGT